MISNSSFRPRSLICGLVRKFLCAWTLCHNKTVKIRASEVSVNEDLTILSEKFKLLKILHFTVQGRFSKSWTLEFAHDTRATTGNAGRTAGELKVL